MKIGLVLTTSSRKLASVKHVMTSVRDALSEHELIFPHPSITWAPEKEQQRLALEFVQECDVIVGLLQPAILAARQRSERWVPYFFLVLGTMPRGAFGLQKYVAQMSTRDSLIVNSRADRIMCERFFGNAHVPIIPLAFDSDLFVPLDAGRRAEIRAEYGFDGNARIILYAGRITPEKNVHGVLRVFGTLCEFMPDLHLVLAGRIVPAAFREFGVTPTAFPLSLARVTEHLVRAPERVLLAGSLPREELRDFYNIADVAINLTLHHDENFGLAQVEAMACGLPVVGSAWGGLKDTIADGRTGYHVSTIATPLGVKVNWWEASSRVLEILQNPDRASRMREEGPRHASQHFSTERLRAELNRLLHSRAGQGARDRGEPLEATAFAREFWDACDPAKDLRPAYRRGPLSLDLYRRMIEPYTGLSSVGIPADAPIAPEQVLCLAVPVAGGQRGGFWPDDPLYPLECEVPAGRARAFEQVLQAFRTEPVTSVERLSSRSFDGADLPGTLDWMIRSGVLLRSNGLPGWVAPHRAPGSAGEPVFGFQRLPPAGIDFVVSG